MEGYILALEDLKPHELELGCKRILRVWKWQTMPPPGVIRDAVAAELEIQSYSIPHHSFVNAPRLTLEEAWADWAEVSKLKNEMELQLGIVARAKQPKFNETERRALLEEQKKIIKEKYGGK